MEVTRHKKPTKKKNANEIYYPDTRYLNTINYIS